MPWLLLLLLLLLLQGAIVLGMIGFSYASVPLYRAFCQVRPGGAALRPLTVADSTVSCGAGARC
jgi:cytochrome c oxidase assembly protein Cox11